MDKRKYFHMFVGGAAFVIGGLLARSKAIEVVENLEEMYEGKFGPNDDISE